MHPKAPPPPRRSESNCRAACASGAVAGVVGESGPTLLEALGAPGVGATERAADEDEGHEKRARATPAAEEA